MARDYQRLTTQNEQDVLNMAHANSAPLHYCTQTAQCEDPTTCPLCFAAARLAVQFYRPIIEKRVVESLMTAYDVRCTLPHPGGD